MARHHRRLIAVLALAVTLAAVVATVGADWDGNLVAVALVAILGPAVGWSVRRPGERLPDERRRHRSRPLGA